MLTETEMTILARVPMGECLAQLAEEATELAQAALKLRRALDGTHSPTPVPVEEAQAKLIEEMGDVQACVNVTRLRYHAAPIRGVAEYKLDRWAERLKDKDEEADSCEKTT